MVGDRAQGQREGRGSQVLGQLGWRLHRIWSLDWWADAEREIQRAHGAIVAAVAAAVRGYRRRMRDYATASELDIWYDRIDVPDLFRPDRFVNTPAHLAAVPGLE